MNKIMGRESIPDTWMCGITGGRKRELHLENGSTTLWKEGITEKLEFNILTLEK